MTPTKFYYKISEVSAMLDVSASTLHYWEEEFEQFDPPRSDRGMRKYRPEDVEVCKQIKHLLRDKGYSLEYAKKAMSDYRKCPPRNPFVCKSADDALRLFGEANNRCVEARLHRRYSRCLLG